MCRRILTPLVLTLLLLLSSCVNTQPVPKLLQPPRLFRYVDNPPSLRVVESLRITGSIGGGNWIKAIELDAEEDPISGDTLLIWLQHYSPGASLDFRAISAPNLLTCHPEAMPEFFRKMHMFPTHKGSVLLVDLRSGKDNSYMFMAFPVMGSWVPGLGISRKDAMAEMVQ